MVKRIDKAFDYLMINEGGLADDPVDLGGKTIYGIASRYHPKAYNECYELYKISKSSAYEFAKMFYEKRYWNVKYNFIQDSSLAFRVFDFGVNAGIRRAVKLFQRAVNYAADKEMLVVDGKFGQKTLMQCNQQQQERVYVVYCILIYNFYLLRPTKWKYLRGWRNRLLRRYWLSDE